MFVRNVFFERPFTRRNLPQKANLTNFTSQFFFLVLWRPVLLFMFIDMNGVPRRRLNNDPFPEDSPHSPLDLPMPVMVSPHTLTEEDHCISCISCYGDSHSLRLVEDLDLSPKRESLLKMDLMSPRPSCSRSPVKDENDKRLTCTYPGCGRLFKRTEHLNRHVRMHTGEKPYACLEPNCNRRFSRSDNMHAHMLRAHKKKPTSKQKAFARMASLSICTDIISARDEHLSPLSAMTPSSFISFTSLSPSSPFARSVMFDTNVPVDQLNDISLSI